MAGYSKYRRTRKKRSYRKKSRAPSNKALSSRLTAIYKALRPPLRSYIDNPEVLEPIDFTATVTWLRHPGTISATSNYAAQAHLLAPILEDDPDNPTVPWLHVGSNLNTLTKTYERLNTAQTVEMENTSLEVVRPLLYIPRLFEQMCGETRDVTWQDTQGRNARICKNVRMRGSFRITMISGHNDPVLWQNARSITDRAGTTEWKFGDVKFSDTQYVRVIGLVVNDMGDGYGPQEEATQDDEQTDMLQMRKGSATNNKMYHLLAPSPTDIFHLYARDPQGQYCETTAPTTTWPADQAGIIPVDSAHVDARSARILDTTLTNGHGFGKLYDNKLLHYSYKRHTGPNSVPETSIKARDRDPLEGHRRDRNYTVFMDKKIGFEPSGSQTATFQGAPGAMEAEFKWSHTEKMIRCCQTDISNSGSHTQTRKADGVNKRIFFYFFPSIARHAGGATPEMMLHLPTSGALQRWQEGTGHHMFTVKRGPERITWHE